MAGLRKHPGTDAELGMYEISGSLAGITGPGRRTVRELEVRRLDGDDLSPLGAFGELELLRIERSRRLDLASLPPLPGVLLVLESVSEIDLSGLDGREDLSGLWLFDFRDCTIPTPLRLPSALEELVVVLDGPDLDGTAMHELLSAVDWGALDRLRKLDLRVSLGDPIGIDLRFLQLLPELQRLEVRDDIRSAGPGSSPLEPPFDGLPKRLTHVSFTSRDPDRITASIRDYLEVGAHLETVISIEPRFNWEPGDPMWEMVETGFGWETFGSFAAASARPTGDEDSARADAERRLAEAAPELARRLDFRRSPPGSSVLAASSEDLRSALAQLGLDSGEPPSGEGTPGRLAPGAHFSGVDAGGRDWVVHPSVAGGWSVYGSFFELFDGAIGDTESEAMGEARRRLRRTDRGLERRLDFDQEADGTGVSADIREDLEAMLTILRGDS